MGGGILSENGATAKECLAAGKTGVAQTVIAGAGQRAEQHLVGAAGTAAGILVILGGALGMQAEVLGQGGQFVPVGLSDRAVLENDAGGHQTRQGEQYVSQFHELKGSVREGPQGRGACEGALWRLSYRVAGWGRYPRPGNG